jgi:hypothetical protein
MIRRLTILACVLLAPGSVLADRDPDITVGWISRTPTLDWVRDSPHPSCRASRSQTGFFTAPGGPRLPLRISAPAAEQVGPVSRP